MPTPIRFREAVLESGWFKIKPDREDLGLAMAFIRNKKDRLYELEMKEHRKKRSKDANAKAWALLSDLAAVLKIPSKEIYRGYIRDIGDVYEIVPVRTEHIKDWERIWCSGHIGRSIEDMGECRTFPGYHNIKSYIGSSDYDTKQMARLLDLIIQDCKQLGIETLSEREKSLLLEDWDAKIHKSESV